MTKNYLKCKICGMDIPYEIYYKFHGMCDGCSIQKQIDEDYYESGADSDWHTYQDEQYFGAYHED